MHRQLSRNLYVVTQLLVYFYFSFLFIVAVVSHLKNAQNALLQGQLQQTLDRLQPGRFEVRIDFSLSVKSEGTQEKVLTPDLAVVDITCAQPIVRWVIDSVEGDMDGSCYQSAQLLSRFYAWLGIADCWILGMPQAELRAYCSVDISSADSPLPNYQSAQLYTTGAQVSPMSIPNIALQVQEPLPLYFLTRTASGQRTHLSNALPLRVCGGGL